MIFRLKKRPTTNTQVFYLMESSTSSNISILILKISKGISAIKKIGHNMPRKSLATIYKAFLRSLIDYGDITYYQPQNESI